MFTLKDEFYHRMQDLTKRAVQGYWKDMYNLRDLRLYCPDFKHVDDLLTHAYYFDDEEGGQHHPPTIVLLGMEAVYVQEADTGTLYKFLWTHHEAAFRYVQQITRIPPHLSA